ncbi:MAG: fumarate reductase subunit FrdD [Gemmatimonadaceae bacterium]
MVRRSGEPLVWLMFSAGGVLAALVMPVLVVLFGIAFPLGWIASPDAAHLSALLRSPLVRLALFVVFAMSLVHGAHRFRYTLYDGLQVKHLNELINLVCYGGALGISVWAAYVLWRVA